jgi:hypothetical protein
MGENTVSGGGNRLLDPRLIGVEGVLRTEDVWVDVPAELEHRVMAEVRATLDQPAASRSATVVSLAGRRGRSRLMVGGRLGLVAASALIAASAGVGAAALVSQDDQTAVLSGTPLAQNARAVAEVRDTPSGVEVMLKTSGLPPATSGTYYQAWVKGIRGAVAIGTFHLRDGTDEIALWSGVSLAEYPTITVTVQSEGAGPESSGRVVLTGDVPRELR